MEVKKVEKPRIYEIMFIVSPKLDQEERDAKVEKVKSWITERIGAQIESFERWGMRKLAYRTRQGFTEGDYTWGIFRALPSKVKELDSLLKIDPEIFRWQIFRRFDLEKKERKKEREKQNIVVEEPIVEEPVQDVEQANTESNAEE